MPETRQVLTALIAKWRSEAARHLDHGDCYRRGEGWGLLECADELERALAVEGEILSRLRKLSPATVEAVEREVSAEDPS